ncbi:hypothetical protein V8D89_004993 [Ganoderma adspersum]
MDARFHQLDVSAFNRRIPGVLPTAANRAKFVKPDIKDKNMPKSAACIELTRTIKSILDAAEADHGFEVLRTPYHHANGDLGKPEDSVSHVEIYPTTEAARRATRADLTKEDISRS